MTEEERVALIKNFLDKVDSEVVLMGYGFNAEGPDIVIEIDNEYSSHERDLIHKIFDDTFIDYQCGKTRLLLV